MAVAIDVGTTRVEEGATRVGEGCVDQSRMRAVEGGCDASGCESDVAWLDV